MVFPLALPALAPLAIAAGKALGLGALSGGAGFGVSSLLKKITVRVSGHSN